MKTFAPPLAVLWTVLSLPALAQDGAALNTITRVEVKSGAVEITGTRKPSFSTFPMSDPPRLVVDISEAVFKGVPEAIDVTSGRVVAIKTASYGSDASAIARVVIGFDREVEPDIQTVGNKLVVRAAPAPGAAPVASAAGSTRSAAKLTEETAKPAPTVAAAPAAASASATAAAAASEKQRQEAAAAATAEKERQEAAAAERQRQEAAAAATAERQRQEAAAAAAAEKQRQEAAAAAAAEKQRQEAAAATEERKRQAAVAAAAAEERKRQEAAAAATAAEEKRRLEAAAAAAAAEERRKREDAAAAAAAEEKRRQEAAAAAAAEEKRRAQEALTARTAEEKRQAELAAAAAEEKRRQESAAAAAAAETQRKQQAAVVAAAAEEKRRQDAAAAAAAEEKRQLAAAQAAEERRRQDASAAATAEAKRESDLTLARQVPVQKKPAPVAKPAASEPLAISASGPSSGGVDSGKRKALTLVGFDEKGPRVFVRTSAPVRYSVNAGAKNTIVLELDNTSILLHNNTRALDTAYFPGPVLRIQPERGPKNTVRVAITLRDAVAYETRQDGNEVSVQFARAP